MYEVKNAQITKVFIGVEDHGIPTCYISLDYGGSGQSFGGYDLRHVSHQMFLFELMEVLGVSDVGKLSGLTVRAKADGSKVHAIGHILEDKWFDPLNYDGAGMGE